jgi:choline dehydrogenase-like flavoprotein
MNFVIGSGPAGVAATAALLERGELVTMVDAGGELEPAIQATVDRVGGMPPDAWQAADLRSLKGNRLRYNSEGAPLKLAFGSDYPYRDVDALQPVEARGVDAYRSLATGGLSTLWGASILPFSDRDFEQWPVTAAQMRPHYVSALGMTGLAGSDDALSQLYPLPVAPTTLALSTQARYVIEHAERHAADLARQQIYVGRARLAIAQPAHSGASCVYCGMCLYGCPYGVIYSTVATLRTRLMASAGFSYVGGVIVRKLSERAGRVIIDAVSRTTAQPRTFEADRVYLGAGVLGSTAILLESLQAASHPLLLRQSDHFLLPLLLPGFGGRVATERLHTLSQLFIEVLNPTVSRHGVHLQLYTYSDFYSRMAHDKLGFLYPLMSPLIDRVIERAALLKGYLHSEESAGIRVTLDRHSSRSLLRLEAVPSRRTRDVVRAVVSLIRKNRRHLGAAPVSLALRQGLPGSGVHVGGSFPMRRTPAEFESDVHGRPTGFERVHVVDSSVFPTMPAAPPTLTIMANAYRIASEAASGLQVT